MRAKRVIESLNEDYKYDPYDIGEEIKEIIEEMSLESKILFLQNFYQKDIDRTYVMSNPHEIDSILSKDLLAGKYDITDLMEYFAEEGENDEDDENLAY